jgi:hypothetical protein
MTKVQIDGQTYDFAIAPELLQLDTGDPGAAARRDTTVRRELAKFNPATADATLEWSTLEGGETLIKVSRQAKTKGAGSGAAGSVSPVLEALLAAPQEIPLALTLSLTLKHLEITGLLRRHPDILLAYSSRIEAALQTTESDSQYGQRVFRHLLDAQPIASPWPVLGF